MPLLITKWLMLGRDCNLYLGDDNDYTSYIPNVMITL